MIKIVGNKMEHVDGPNYVVRVEKNVELVARGGEVFSCCDRSFIVVNGFPVPVECSKYAGRVFDGMLYYAIVSSGLIEYSTSNGTFRLSDCKISANGWTLDVQEMAEHGLKTSDLRSKRRVSVPFFKDKFCGFELRGWYSPSKKGIVMRIFPSGARRPFVDVGITIKMKKNAENLARLIKSIEDGTIVKLIDGRPIKVRFCSFDYTMYLHLKEFITGDFSVHGDVVLPGIGMKINGRDTIYLGTNRWRSGEYVRYDSSLYRIIDTEFGKGLKGSDEVILFDVSLPSGQYVPVARLFTKYARLYYIVTPEGIFTVDVPKDWLKTRKEVISVFDKGVKPLGTMYVFPMRILERETGIFLDKTGFILRIGNKKMNFKDTIDDSRFNGWLKKLGIEDEYTSIVSEFGFSFV